MGSSEGSAVCCVGSLHHERYVCSDETERLCWLRQKALHLLSVDNFLVQRLCLYHGECYLLKAHPAGSKDSSSKSVPCSTSTSSSSEWAFSRWVQGKGLIPRRALVVTEHEGISLVHRGLWLSQSNESPWSHSKAPKYLYFFLNSSKCDSSSEKSSSHRMKYRAQRI